MAPPLHFTKDLYKLLHLPRTATTPEIKQSYRRIALALHPDRHNGCPNKSDEFKAVTEAYLLIDYGKRVEYDKWLSSVRFEGDKVVKKGVSRAAERNPFYRKVYSPQAPPGMKTFDRQRHYGEFYE
jgi:molecular chaperone DnaJ